MELCAACIFHCLTCKLTTLGSFVSAVGEWHVSHGCGQLPRHETYDRLKKGLENTFGRADHRVPKTAFSMADLAKIHSHLNPHSFEDTRDWCMLTLAFFGVLRIGEYCDGGLRMGDIAIHSWGIRITIRFSKTSTHPVEVSVAARGDDDLLCPLRALLRYVARIHLQLLANRDVPLFLKHPLMKEGVTAGTFVKRIQALAASIGLNPAEYAGHSLRRGGATALYIAGVPEAVIQQHGRWKSLAVRSYLEASSYYQLVPTMLLLRRSAGLFPVPRQDPLPSTLQITPL